MIILFRWPDTNRRLWRKRDRKSFLQKKAATAPKQKIQDRTSANKTLAKSSTKTFKIPANTEIPRLKEKRQEQVIKHEGYTVSYNSEYRIANWVAYELTATEAKKQKDGTF